MLSSHHPSALGPFTTPFSTSSSPPPLHLNNLPTASLSTSTNPSPPCLLNLASATVYSVLLLVPLPISLLSQYPNKLTIQPHLYPSPSIATPTRFKVPLHLIHVVTCVPLQSVKATRTAPISNIQINIPTALPYLPWMPVAMLATKIRLALHG